MGHTGRGRRRLAELREEVGITVVPLRYRRQVANRCAAPGGPHCLPPPQLFCAAQVRCIIEAVIWQRKAAL